ncbi:MAG TPA: aminotransferase class V-fold PLP-dependent enzyme, partial [Candidatus Paceibacterota bacterium]
EIGTIEPIQEIAKIIRHKRKENNSIYPLFHTDACQATYLPLEMNKLGVDMLTLDSHKIYGPRGVGMLYIKRGIKLEPLIHGGGQEEGLRSGTENIPGILGFSLALELAEKNREKENNRLIELKNIFIEGLKKINPKIKINGNIENSSSHILNIHIPNIDNEFFLLKLDANGIECSTKSACLTDEDKSYVLNAINSDSKSSLRFSFGRQTKKSDIAHTLKIIVKII